MSDRYMLHYIEEAIENFYQPEIKCYEGLNDLSQMLKEAKNGEEYFDILVDIDNLLCDIECKEIDEATKDE